MKQNNNKFTFPVGYHKFHKNELLNFKLNHIYSLGYWTMEEAQKAGSEVKELPEFKQAFIEFAEKNEAEGMKLTAVFGYRVAEFFTSPTDKDKMALYDRFHDLFYETVQDKEMELLSIPYLNGLLPALRFSPEDNKGTIVLHGGLDSFMEEFYSVARYIMNAGYEIILFEGPGQGSAHRKSNLYMTHEWEKPTSAVLDYLDLTDVSLVGVSMGGYLAPRAAAFDDRITRVVAFDVTPYDLHGSGLQAAIYRFLVRNPSLYNKIATAAMKRSARAELVVGQWMYITGASTPAEWNEQLPNYSVSDIAQLIHQDVLLMAGEKDQMIPLKEYHNNMNGLPNARSVSGRIFTAEEHAQNHCQVGNCKLALDVILQWVGEKS